MLKEITTNQAREIIKNAKKYFLHKMGNDTIFVKIENGKSTQLSEYNVPLDITSRFVSRFEVELYFNKLIGGGEDERTLWTPKPELELLNSGKLLYVL